MNGSIVFLRADDPTVRLKPGGKLQMINRRVDIASQRVSKAQERREPLQTLARFRCSGRARRAPLPDHPFEVFHTLPETLDGFTGKVEGWRTLPSKRMSAQLAVNGKRVVITRSPVRPSSRP